MIKSTQFTNTKKCQTHYYPNKKIFNLFNKRLVICDSKELRPSYLLNNADAFKEIIKKLPKLSDFLNMRLINRKSRKLTTCLLHLLSSIPFTMAELCNSKNIKRNFALANTLKIKAKLSTDDDIENLTTFIKEAENHTNKQLLLSKIEAIDCENEIIDDNLQAIQILLDLLASIPSLDFLSLSKLWAPITFKSLLLKRLYVGFVNAPLEFKELNNLTTLHFRKITAPVILPEQFHSLKSLTCEEIIGEAETEQRIKIIQQSIADKSESITEL